MAIKKFNLKINELVINAMPTLSVSLIQATVQSELAKLLAENNESISPTMFTLNNIDLEVKANDSALTVGQDLARAIYQGVMKRD